MVGSCTGGLVVFFRCAGALLGIYALFCWCFWRRYILPWRLQFLLGWFCFFYTFSSTNSSSVFVVFSCFGFWCAVLLFLRLWGCGFFVFLVPVADTYIGSVLCSLIALFFILFCFFFPKLKCWIFTFWMHVCAVWMCWIYSSGSFPPITFCCSFCPGSFRP